MNTTRAAIEASTLSDETRKAGFWRRRGHPAAAEAQAEIREAEKALDRALDDAEPLLGYLVESGIQLGDEEKAAVARIIAARLSRDTAWTAEGSGDLFAALTRLADKVKPVTADTLRLCAASAGKILRRYWIGTMCLALVIVCLSVISFVTSGISKANTASIRAANELAVKLVSQIGVAGSASSAAGPRVVLSDLQAFAATTRSIHQRANLLNRLSIPPFKAANPELPRLQLPVPLEDPPAAASAMVQHYQSVREFADMARGHTELVYGAIGTIILPILYALLGSCAYLLRLFSKQVRARSYAPSYADYAHLLVAGIGGGVVGLFNNFTFGEGLSLPPLAIAFLVGYAADMFFTRLDNFLPMPARPAAPSAK
jgi:hypothetical protein